MDARKPSRGEAGASGAEEGDALMVEARHGVGISNQ
jgi:hypothetical protein